MTDSLTQQPADPTDAAAAARLTTAPEPVGPTAGERGAAAARRAWRQLTSMRTALQLLFLLALAAVPGSVLPQHGNDDARVQRFYGQHPSLAPVLDRLSLFDVFASPWFAAVYLLLFISLIGCLVPRMRLHARALRAQPPPAPRHFSRLPAGESWRTDAPPAAAIDAAARMLSGARWRVVRGGDATLSAEKGYLRETGNLLLHVALVALLAAIAMGGLWGYKGDVLLVEGRGFSNTPLAYDSLHPGRLFDASRLQPFTVGLRDFRATYLATGQPRSFDADVTWRPSPGAPTTSYDIKENHPLTVDPHLLTGGVRVYLGGHGYAPHFVVRDAKGAVVFDDDVPFLPDNATTYQSNGVVKVADAAPEQLALQGFFTPTTVATSGGLQSAFPAARNPAVTLTAYHGRLVDTGSVYSLDTSQLHQYGDGHGRIAAQTLFPGQTWRLVDGTSITFTGFKEFANFHVTYDPGKRLALVAASALVLGLLLSLRVRRRRLWVRATAPEGGRTVVEVGGLARSDGDRFAEELGELSRRLQRRLPERAPQEE
ncbi:MAG: cytochrome c biogenesis protein ResB [Frankiaceae bacterium]